MELERRRRRPQFLQRCDALRNPIVHISDRTSHDLDAEFVTDHITTPIIPATHDPAHKKLAWLRSQIVGHHTQFQTPFGNRRLTYADHTASGRSLHYIENYITTHVLPFYGNSHTSDSKTGYHTTKMVHEASNYVKKCVGAGEEDDAILFCGSGSTAAIKRLQEVMGIAIPSILRDRMLNCLSDQERWVVFVGPYEHHSNLLSWRRSLAEVIEIGLDGRGLIDVDSLREKLEFYKAKNRPILASFSACSNVTGICTDTRGIARLVHRFGGFVCFDFAASGPYEKIEMKSGEIEGYDGIFLSPHKFLGGPGTPGILVMNKALYRLGSAAPSTCGGGTVDFVNGFNEEDTIYTNNIEERENAGTPQITQTIRAALTFWIKEFTGHTTIHMMEQSHISRALARLFSNPHVKVLGNTLVPRQAILSFLVYTTTTNSGIPSLDMWRETGEVLDKPLHGPFVAKLLNDLFGIQARGGCACAGPYGHALLAVDQPHSRAFRSAIEKGYMGIKPGWTRVSFPYYMSEEEMEFIMAGIEFVAIYGQRFLPLYHFSWREGTWTFKQSAGNDGEIGYRANMMIKSLNEKHKMKKNVDEDEDLVSKYTTYLEIAKQIANLLPKFPPHTKIPEDINEDLVPFRV